MWSNSSQTAPITQSCFFLQILNFVMLLSNILLTTARKIELLVLKGSKCCLFYDITIETFGYFLRWPKKRPMRLWKILFWTWKSGLVDLENVGTLLKTISSRPKTSVNGNQVELVREKFMSDSGLTVWELSEQLVISFGSNCFWQKI